MAARPPFLLSWTRLAVLVLALLGVAHVALASGTRPHRLVIVAGTVSAVDAAGGNITIQPQKAAAVTLQVNAQTRLSLDGSPTHLGDIPVGAEARARYDTTTKVALRIQAVAQPTLATVQGAVTAVTSSSITITPEPPEDGAAVTLGTDASTKVILNGASSSLSALAVGDEARALYDSSTLVAAAIEAESPHHQLAAVQGEVTAVGASSITVTPQHGSAVTLGTNSSTQIFLNGASSTLSAIRVGDWAGALYDSTTLIASVIQAATPHQQLADVEGQVTAVSGSSITITPEQGSAVTLGADASTQVFLNGASSTLSAITVGDQARALYDSTTLIASVIQAATPRQQLAAVQGEVTAVGAASITITPDHLQGAAAVTLATSSSTQVFLNGSMSSLASIAVGDRAGALYDSATMTAIVIQALAAQQLPAEVEGQVTVVGTGSLTIAPGDSHHGSPVTLSTSSTTQIFLNSRPSTLSALAAGDWARALYDSSTLTALVVEAESDSGH
jgi:hypothetical protein